MSENDVTNRLSIQVPNFDTRLNMGSPDPGGDQPFGYMGFSYHTNFNSFIDVGRVGLYQSNLGSCWQVGGKWLQWSNQDMYMATMGNNTLAADNKVLIASGAGQGQVTALTSAGSMLESPRLVEYNNLALHWRVDAVQVVLKQFFYGDDDAWRDPNSADKSVQAKYATETSYPGGFLKDVEDFLDMVDQKGLKLGLLRGFEWEGDRYDTKGQASYFTALEPFDPYPPMTYTDFFLSKAYAITIQVLNWMHRTVDVLRRIGSALTDNPIGKRAQALIQAWQDGQEAVNAYKNGKIDFDQWTRRGGETDVLAGHLPKNAPTTGHVDATAAKLTSASGPYDISAVDPLTMDVYDSEGDAHATVDFGAFRAAGVVTVPQLAAALSGNTGSATVGGDGSTVTITSNIKGKVSYLKVSGKLATTFFGGDPAISRGEDASDPSDENADTMRSIQISFSSLPEDFRDQIRPLYQAATDWLAVADRAVNVVGDMLSVFSGPFQPPSMLGLIAKDGITLGTPAPMYGTGGGITFVATGKAGDGDKDPDKKKFVPGLEKVVKFLLDMDDPLKDALQSSFIPDSDIRKRAMPGNFRVAAQADVVMTAKGNIMHVALGETWLLSQKKINLVSNDEATLVSYTNTVDVAGTEVRIGNVAPSGKQKPTKKVRVVGSERIDLFTDKHRLNMGGDYIFVGKDDKSSSGVLLGNPHLAIGTADGSTSLQAGYWDTDAAKFYGFEIKGTGDAQILSKTNVSIGVENGGAVAMDKSAVTISKDLKVGQALIVKGDGNFSPQAASKMKKAEKLIAQKTTELSGKYSTAMTKAKALGKTLGTLETAIQKASGPARDKLVDQETSTLDDLYETEKERSKIMAEADSLEIPLSDIGLQPDDGLVFLWLRGPRKKP